MDNIEFLTEEEKNAMSIEDLGTYLDILKLMKSELEKINN